MFAYDVLYGLTPKSKPLKFSNLLRGIFLFLQIYQQSFSTVAWGHKKLNRSREIVLSYVYLPKKWISDKQLTINDKKNSTLKRDYIIW